MLSRTRSRTQAILQLHPNEEIAYALHSIQPLLNQHQLQYHDYGQSPDCQFTSFIHASKKKIPTLEDIMAVRRACRNWLYVNRLLLVNQSRNGKTASRLSVQQRNQQTRKRTLNAWTCRCFCNTYKSHHTSAIGTLLTAIQSAR